MGRTYKVSQQDAEMLMRLRRSQYESRAKREAQSVNAQWVISTIVMGGVLALALILLATSGI